MSFVLLGIALSGVAPLVAIQIKQYRKLEQRFNDQNTYYLVPSTDSWARKLGAGTTIQTTDPGAAPAEPITLVDNGDADYSETTSGKGSGWSHNKNQKAYLDDDRSHTKGTGKNSATWSFTTLEPGWYDVRITWASSKAAATNAPFTVYLDGSSAGTYTINQKKAPSGSSYQNATWQSLGTFAVKGALQVTLTDKANGKVIADAVRALPVKNDVQIGSVEKSLTSEEATAHITVTVWGS
jgi:hypothetical protein